MMPRQPLSNQSHDELAPLRRQQAQSRRTLARARRSRPRQGGFNFAEVLFAVMILGIGFIMVAAIFPAAMMQTKSTQEESAGASIARGGAGYLNQLANNVTMPATGNEVWALDEVPAIRGGLVLPSDGRYAWVPLYRRAGTPANAPGAAPPNPIPTDWSGTAQIFMIPVAVRTSSVYDKGISRVAKNPGAGVRPSAVMTAQVVDSTSTLNTDGVDYIEFPADPAGNYQTVAAGAYVIIASTPDRPDDQTTGANEQVHASPTAAHPLGAWARVGHIFRIGSATDNQPAGTTYTRRWALAPGWDYKPELGDYNNAGGANKTDTSNDYPLVLAAVNVFVVGRAIDPNSSTGERGANSQDVGAYTSFLSVR
jgi:hypothetical protein